MRGPIGTLHHIWDPLHRKGPPVLGCHLGYVRSSNRLRPNSRSHQDRGFLSLWSLGEEGGERIYESGTPFVLHWSAW